MTQINRYSPVKFTAAPVEMEMRDGWPVSLRLEKEGPGPYLTDLSHKTRWDLQDSDLSRFRPANVAIPETPGSCNLENNVLINRMNRTQASIWHLGASAPAMPDEPGYTDITEAAAHLALYGPNAFLIAEKLTALDLQNPAEQAPYLIQGPLGHVPCQIVVLKRGPESDGCILFTCSRGYGASMVHSVLCAGEEFGLRPAGEKRFTNACLTT